jgi:hypothetical protein
VSRRKLIENKIGKPSNNQIGFRPYSPNIMDDMLSLDPPTFDDNVFDPKDKGTYDDQPLDSQVSELLHDYVHLIASMYRNENPYHNFEHAAYTIMSIVSLLTGLYRSKNHRCLLMQYLEGPCLSRMHLIMCITSLKIR